MREYGIYWMFLGWYFWCPECGWGLRYDTRQGAEDYQYGHDSTVWYGL